MLANSKYDVTINGQGFILLAESYRKKAQQPFSPRFATGDPGLGDLSFWQFQGIKTWDGGAGQQIFETLTKHRQSVGWDFRNTRLGRGPALSCGTKDVAYSAGSLSALNKSKFFQRAKMVLFGASAPANTFLMLIGRYTNATGSPGTLSAQTSSDTEDPPMKQLDTIDAEVWDRNSKAGAGGGYGTVLLYVKDGVSGAFNVDFIQAMNPGMTSQVITLAGADMGFTRGSIRSIVPIDGTHFAVFYSDGTYNNVAVVGFTADSFDAATRYTSVITAGSDMMAGTWTMDSSGTIYVITQNQDIPGAGGSNAKNHGRLLAFTATDILSTNGPRCSATYDLPADFYPTGLASVGGTVYVLGAFRPTSTEQYAAILTPAGAIVWMSEYNYVGEDNYIRAYHDSRTETYFVVKNNLGQYASIMRLRSGGIVEEVCAIPSWATGTFDVMTCASYGRRLYWYNQVANKIQCTNDVKGTLDSSGTYAILELSAFAGNTPIITKTPYSVFIELSEAVPASYPISVLVNDTVVGTITSTDGTSKEIVITADLSATSFSVKLRVPRASTWAGNPKTIYLRYVPTQFKKKAWGFAVRLDRNIKLADGSRESLTPEAAMALLETAWATNTPIPFVDLDAQTYSVIITDFDQRRPIVNSNSAKLESFVFLELLQV